MKSVSYKQETGNTERICTQEGQQGLAQFQSGEFSYYLCASQYSTKHQRDSCTNFCSSFSALFPSLSLFFFFSFFFCCCFFFLSWPPCSIWSSQAKGQIPAAVVAYAAAAAALDLLTHYAGLGIEPVFLCSRGATDQIVPQQELFFFFFLSLKTLFSLFSLFFEILSQNSQPPQHYWIPVCFP